MVKELVFKPKEKEVRKNLVMEGICSSIQLHTKGPVYRTTVEEAFVKNAPLSCVYGIVKQKADINNSSLRILLGASTHQLSTARQADESQ